MNIPTGHQAVMPYLILESANGFIQFAEEILGAKLLNKKMRKNGTSIMHAELQIGESTIMCADAVDNWKAQPGGMFVYVQDADQCYQAALTKGANSIMEPSDQPYGRACGITDPNGNTWWITSVNT